MNAVEYGGRPAFRGTVLLLLVLTGLVCGSQWTGGAEGQQLESNILLTHKQTTLNNATGTVPWTEAQVGPGYSGVIKFSGKLTIHRWPSTKTKQLLVNMDAHLEDLNFVEFDDPGPSSWGISVYPTHFEYYPWEFDRLGAERGVVRDFEVSARAPIRVDADAHKLVVVSAEWLAVPASDALSSGDIAPEGIEMNVAQYFDIIMDSVTPLQTIWPGQETKFTLIINNRGNDDDEFRISLDNEKTLSRRGWAVLIPETSIIVPGHSEGRFDIFVRSPNRLASFYKNEITEIGIMVESKNAVTNNDEEWEVYYVFVHEQGFNFLYNDPVLIIFLIVIIVLMGWAWRTSGRREKERIDRLLMKRKVRRDPRTGEWKEAEKKPGVLSWGAVKKKEEEEEAKYAKIVEGRRVEDDDEDDDGDAEEAEEADEVEGAQDGASDAGDDGDSGDRE